MNGTTNAGSIKQNYGGVARNLAEALHRLKCNPALVTVCGNDALGQGLRHELHELGLPPQYIETQAGSTACYSALLKTDGDLLCAVGDMAIFDELSAEMVDRHHALFTNAKLVCLDGNATLEALARACHLCSSANVPVFFEPTSVEKARKLFDAEIAHHVLFTKPNEDELRAMAAVVMNEPPSVTDSSDQYLCFLAEQVSALLAYNTN